MEKRELRYYAFAITVLIILSLSVYYLRNLIVPTGTSKKEQVTKKQVEAPEKTAQFKIEKVMIDSVPQVLYAKLSSNKLLMLGNNTYGHFVFFKPLMDLLDIWFKRAKENTQREKVGIVLEKRPDQINLINTYIKTGRKEVLFGDKKTILPAIISAEEMAFFNYLYYLKQEIDAFNKKHNRSIDMKLIGVEKEVDPWLPIEELSTFALKERDEYVFQGLKKVFDDNPDHRFIAFYGNSHLFMTKDIPKEGRKTYLGYYLKDYLKDKGGSFIVGASQSDEIFPKHDDVYFLEARKVIDMLTDSEKKVYAFLFLFDGLIKYPQTKTSPSWFSTSFTRLALEDMLSKPSIYWKSNEPLINMQRHNLLTFLVILENSPQTEPEYNSCVNDIKMLDIEMQKENSKVWNEKRMKWSKMIKDISLFDLWKEGKYFKSLMDGLKITKGQTHSYLFGCLNASLGEMKAIMPYNPPETVYDRLQGFFAQRAEKEIVSGYIRFLFFGDKEEEELANKALSEIAKKNLKYPYNYMTWYYSVYGIK